MKKKLKIKFWKTERALAMQILEQEGLPRIKKSGKVRITGNPAYCGDEIWLRGESRSADNYILSFYFEFQYEVENKIRKITQAITNELFTSGIGELKVGEMCEFSDDKKDWVVGFYFGSILGRNAETEFLSSEDMKSSFYTGWKYARPIAKRTEPKVETNGEIITCTWEEK